MDRGHALHDTRRSTASESCSEPVRLPVVVAPVRRAAVEHRLQRDVRRDGAPRRRAACRCAAAARAPARPSPGRRPRPARAPMTGLPNCSGGRNGSGGASIIDDRDPELVGRLGSVVAQRAQDLRRVARAARRSARRARAGRPGASRYSNAVATPKLPPPPRRPQNSSGSVSASTRMRSPSAVTSSTESRLSTVRPCLRIRCPSPPPSVSPPMPVWLMIPPVVARPAACGGAVELAPQHAAGRARGARRRGRRGSPSSATGRSSRPPSQTAWPATAWPPPRTDTSRSRSRAKRTASTTSSAPAQRAISAGWRSIAPFQMRRASS